MIFLMLQRQFAYWTSTNQQFQEVWRIIIVSVNFSGIFPI
jgi:hypothetical protein